MRLIVFLLTFINGVSAAQWRVVADVPLPGKPGRFDYQSFDVTTGWLWIAHMGQGEVLAFDVEGTPGGGPCAGHAGRYRHTRRAGLTSGLRGSQRKS